MENHSAHIERTYDAPAERVFDAWTSAEVVRRWWRALHHFEVSDAEVDPRVGGVIRVVMHDPRKQLDHGGGGTYTEVDRPNRLAFTWVWDNDPEGRRTLIEIDFSERASRTTVSFSHTLLFSAEMARDHEEGWSGVLDELGAYLATTGS